VAAVTGIENHRFCLCDDAREEQRRNK